MDVAQYTFKGSNNFKKMIKHYERTWVIKKRDEIDWSKNYLNKVYGDTDVDFVNEINKLQAISVKEHKFKRNTIVLGDWCLQCPPEIEGNQNEMDKFFKLANDFTKKRYEKYGFLVKTYTHFEELKENGKPSRSHAHISFIPYGTFIDNKRKNIKDPKRKRSEPVQKTGFCYGYIFSKKELLSYQIELEEYLNSEFNNSLTFGKGNTIRDEHGKGKNVRQLMREQGKALKKANQINKQYEDIISTQKELFCYKYKDNQEVLTNYKASYYQAIELASKKSSIKSVFTRVRDFFVGLFTKHNEKKLSKLISKHKHDNSMTINKN